MQSPDINKLYAQLQHMQKEVMRLQDELKKITVEGTEPEAARSLSNATERWNFSR